MKNKTNNIKLKRKKRNNCKNNHRKYGYHACIQTLTIHHTQKQMNKGMIITMRKSFELIRLLNGNFTKMRYKLYL